MGGLIPTSTPFGHMLRELRMDRRLSQARVADMAGYDHSFLCRLEAGNRDPSREAVETIARVLRLSGPDTDELLMAAGYMPNNAASVLDREPVVARLYEFLVSSAAPESTKEIVRTQVVLIVEQIEALMKRAETEAA